MEAEGGSDSCTSNSCITLPIEKMSNGELEEISLSWTGYSKCTQLLLNNDAPLQPQPSIVSDFRAYVTVLRNHDLQSLVKDHFLRSLEEPFRENGARRFWSYFDGCIDVSTRKLVKDGMGDLLCISLEQISGFKEQQEKLLSLLFQALVSAENSCLGSDSKEANLLSEYHLLTSSIMLSTTPGHFAEFLHLYFEEKLEELSLMLDPPNDDISMKGYEKIDGVMFCASNEPDIDSTDHRLTYVTQKTLASNLTKIVMGLRSIGFASMTENAYASAVLWLLKNKVEKLAGDDFHIPVLPYIKDWIQGFLVQLLGSALSYQVDSRLQDKALPRSYTSVTSPSEEFSEELIRWKLRLEYFAYETLQDLRIAKLFDIIVDYPDSSPAIEDLKQCLDNTGLHMKLIDSFISSVHFRLLTAGASTNDILDQYLSTIKALRRIDPTGVFLEAVGEPIRNYLKGRKDAIKCAVSMLADGTGGQADGTIGGDSLLEELNRDPDYTQNLGNNDGMPLNDRLAWSNAESWQPDPVEVGSVKSNCGRKKVDVLGMMVSVVGSKDQLINQYRVMLAERLTTKSDYNIESEIRSLELFKIHFGESSMHKCEVMLNDMIESKRTNANIKAALGNSDENDECREVLSMEQFDATIISANFWPPFQGELESIAVPEPVNQLLDRYSERYSEVKSLRKLLWKKNLGSVKLELEINDQTVHFIVPPSCAVIIMKFEEQSSWTSKDLAAAVGVPKDALSRAIGFWISKGIIAETVGPDHDDRILTIADNITEMNKNSLTIGRMGCSPGTEDGESSMASVADQMRREMTVYEKFIFGMLTNFESLSLERIHNSLKMFCMDDPPYDKSLEQLQNFVSILISEEKLELKDGMYMIKK